MTRVPIALLLLAFASTAARADQQAWVSRRDADRAALLIPIGTTVRAYCAPCGDPAPTDLKVATVEVASTGYQDMWEVRVNGEGVDLAYTYVRQDGQWENLALSLGLEAQDVPRLLGDGKTGPTIPTPAAELSGAEEEMAGLVDALAGSLPPAAKHGLLRAQEAWRNYRDAQVLLEANLDSDPAAATLARLRLTRARVAELRRLEPGGE